FQSRAEGDCDVAVEVVVDLVAAQQTLDDAPVRLDRLLADLDVAGEVELEVIVSLVSGAQVVEHFLRIGTAQEDDEAARFEVDLPEGGRVAAVEDHAAGDDDGLLRAERFEPGVEVVAEARPDRVRSSAVAYHGSPAGARRGRSRARTWRGERRQR